MEEKGRVTLAHGAGGKQTSELIDQVFKEIFANPDLTGDDAAVLGLEAGAWHFPQTALSSPRPEFPGRKYRKAFYLRHGQ